MKRFLLMLVVLWGGLMACGEEAGPTAVPVPTPPPTLPPPSPLPPTAPPPTVPPPTTTVPLPSITAVSLDQPTLPRYTSLQMTVDLQASYSNPYDARQVTLDGRFTAPDGSEMHVPGFWDGNGSWLLRFTPSQEGEWAYGLTITDSNGSSEAYNGRFTVTPSTHHGWLQPGNRVNPAYSGHYLVHHDGTPFYGIGYCEALNILIDGFNADSGVNLFSDMAAAGANYVVWWPLYAMSPISRSYDDYAAGNMATMDVVVRDAQAKGIYLIFTLWDHPQLRDETHAWGTGQWANNGFNKLTPLDAFFHDEEAWAWQSNWYRYVIARWGYSPAIGMWQTVSEVNGTNAYGQTDAWHARVNQYFVEHDPYRHPTTASYSGDVDWEAGHLVMDAPQVHLYEFDDPVAAAKSVADWTTLMWNRAEKPNWVGEFGVTGNTHYPELFHHSIWAALGAGAAMTPAEWNSGGNWGRMTPEMLADLGRLRQFVADLPLAEWQPQPLELANSTVEVRGWGVAGEAGGILWVQDFALEGAGIEAVRAAETVRSGVEVEVTGLANGRYTITPYDTWQGVFLDAFTVDCTGSPCTLPLPDFKSDMAFKLWPSN